MDTAQQIQTASIDYIDSENDDNEEVLVDYSKENDFMRDSKNPEIYIVKVMKSDYKHTKHHKTGNRVYNSLHCCFFCKKFILHIRPHLRAKHSHIKKVSDAFEDKSGKELNKLRAMGDDMHNRNVITEKKGQLLLLRRPLEQFTATDYGPCPNCLEWISKSNIKRHQSRCISLENSFGVQTKRNLLLQSDVASGRFISSASKFLKDEVFSSMTVDDITEVAKSDVLIIALREYWLRQNIDNPLKRANYSSQRMRLAARLLIELQKQTSEECSMTMWDFLQPSYFDSIVNAALETAIPTFDDEEELKSPSNCLKLKYDILRLVNFKWSFLIKANSSNEEKKKCKNFLQLMSLEFKNKVTKLAYTVLIKRTFTKTKEIPTPSDIELLNRHIHSQLTTCLLNPVKENYRKVRCKPVPVIIPNDCKKPLAYIADNDVRQKVGVFNDNKYLFPNSVNGATRSYESLKTVCSELNLEHPENITSVSMRKYTATLSQVIDLNSNQLEWLCKHLGHTKRVHKEHYQQMSGFIERVKVSKLLLVQDMNLTSKFAGKKLDEITFEDVLSSSKETDKTDERPSITNTPSTSKLPDGYDSDSEEPKDKKRKPNLKRVRWTSEQVKELYKFFKEHLDKKTTPRKGEVLKISPTLHFLSQRNTSKPLDSHQKNGCSHYIILK
ncbi:hypothetical protein LOTGIDRAFT_174659 [Lottia gigantea]|uniref:Uncharacterized protein n=1 Tax=Lottia gigantea TaxID=225164 RepID=V4AJ16_LOTGI|nr:hypothetical protein LOTGIDRAFT_174659 [Lottia gigantea]ESO97052.1 hypothetical protein LOTGIDRAFT_174659 [Lottia gigantea]